MRLQSELSLAGSEETLAGIQPNTFSLDHVDHSGRWTNSIRDLYADGASVYAIFGLAYGQAFVHIPIGALRHPSPRHTLLCPSNRLHFRAIRQLPSCQVVSDLILPSKNLVHTSVHDTFYAINACQSVTSPPAPKPRQRPRRVGHLAVVLRPKKLPFQDFVMLACMSSRT